jgi:hypothetical protein
MVSSSADRVLAVDGGGHEGAPEGRGQPGLAAHDAQQGQDEEEDHPVEDGAEDVHQDPEAGLLQRAQDGAVQEQGDEHGGPPQQAGEDDV